MRRRLLPLVAGIVATLLAAPVAAQERVVNVFNWNDYIDPYMVQRFTRETGIRVRYDVYDSLETLEGRLSAGRSGYDIVVPTSEPTFSRLARAGAFRPIDRALVPNLRNLDPALQRQVAESDPGEPVRRALSLGDDRARHQPRAHPRAGARRAAGQPGAADEPGACAAHRALRHHHDGQRVGRDPDGAALSRPRPEQHRCRRPAGGGAGADGDPPAYPQLLDRRHDRGAGLGQSCLAFAYSGDAIQAAARAREAGRGVTVQYVAPKEGAQLWFDLLAIPADAPNAANAHAFINFLLQPDVMAAVTAHVRYPNGVAASRALLPPEIANDPAVFPVRRRGRPSSPSGRCRRPRPRAQPVWSRFKAGR
jgi:putrescine transport system substrate-binding protein